MVIVEGLALACWMIENVELAKGIVEVSFFADVAEPSSSVPALLDVGMVDSINGLGGGGGGSWFISWRRERQVEVAS